MEHTKPDRLRRGDRIAIVSTSWGGPSVFPHVFEAGLATLTDRFGLHVQLYPTTLMTPAALAADPRARARDLNAAFADRTVKEPTIAQVRAWMFKYGVQGVFDVAAGLLVGRARGYSDEAKAALDEMIVDTVVRQFGATHLTIVTNMDFGHTDPQLILPLGVLAELDPSEQSFRLLEPAVT